MRLPYNADRLLAMRTAGKAPDPVYASFCGFLWPESGPLTLLAQPGRAYDWRCLAGLRVICLIDDGLGSASDLRAIAASGPAETMVWHRSKKGGGWMFPDWLLTEDDELVNLPGVRLIQWPESHCKELAETFEHAADTAGFV